MVDLGGYVIVLVETRDKKIKLYGNAARLLLLSKEAPLPDVRSPRSSGPSAKFRRLI